MSPSRSAKLALSILLALPAAHIFATTITQWSFSATAAAPANSPAPSTGSGTATTLGMGAGSGGFTGHVTDVASDDVLLTAGTAVPAFSENTWRIRGAPSNGWATHAAGAAQFTQGLELDASTVGYTAIGFSFDWYSTNQAIRDLQFQYNTDITNPAGWTNFGGTSATGTYIAVPNDYYGATASPQNSHTAITIDLSSIPAANNDAKFGIRLVSAYDSTGNIASDYASATLSAGLTTLYNNTSGNWRFDNMTFTGTATAAPEPASLAMLALASVGLLARRRK